MAKDEITIIKPPKNAIQSLQYDLFRQFVTNDPSDVSNTVEIWESIPKYFFTPKQVEKLRTSNGSAQPYEWEYTYNGVACIVVVQPAQIKQENGSYKAFFPSTTEEFVEEALKKILSDQQYGIHDPDNVQTWVRFSLSLLRRELMERGRGRTNQEIKHAISVMNKCNISVVQDGKEVWSGAILQDLVTVGRKEYLEDTDAHHVARLPLFISQSINRLDYRQFNYDRLMSCNEQLTRWIYKRLINRFKQASIATNYHFMYSELRESGLLQQARELHNRQKVKSALDELKNRGVLFNYETYERKEGRKIVDVKYVVFPTPDFTHEQKAANKRSLNAHAKAVKIRSLPVDK